MMCTCVSVCVCVSVYVSVMCDCVCVRPSVHTMRAYKGDEVKLYPSLS